LVVLSFVVKVANVPDHQTLAVDVAGIYRILFYRLRAAVLVMGPIPKIEPQLDDITIRQFKGSAAHRPEKS
jgi:hypothetical protein